MVGNICTIIDMILHQCWQQFPAFCLGGGSFRPLSGMPASEMGAVQKSPLYRILAYCTCCVLRSHILLGTGLLCGRFISGWDPSQSQMRESWTIQRVSCFVGTWRMVDIWFFDGEAKA